MTIEERLIIIENNLNALARATGVGRVGRGGEVEHQCDFVG
jgi:hypothetical protein